MGKIEQSKTYTGEQMEKIIFRPIVELADPAGIGASIMYNMPVPTTLHFWEPDVNVLQKFSASGWNGSGSGAAREKKTIGLSPVKAEMSYNASDYFDLVYKQMTGRSDFRMDDLSGTVLEEAETDLFKQSIAESIRATMWLGNTARAGAFNTFDGLLKKIMDESDPTIQRRIFEDLDNVAAILNNMWADASYAMRSAKGQGNLVFLVTSDIYEAYEDYLDGLSTEASYQDRQNGRKELAYKGIPLLDLRLSKYLSQCPDLPATFVILTDRRNLAMVLNTADFPGSEVRMWYNPDQMENRQRAVFMAGCDYLLPEFISVASLY